MEASLRVQICDDNGHIRAALRRLLEGEPDITVVGEASRAEEAIEQARERQPDVLILDVAMPGQSGLDALPDLRSASPATAIVMLSLHDDPVYERHARAAGADGYVAKDAADGLAQLVRDIAHNQRLRPAGSPLNAKSCEPGGPQDLTEPS